MNTQVSTFARWLLLVNVALAQSLLAQVITTSTREQNLRDDKEEAVVLSPFVVKSDKDTGYQATTTLAGTRLNTAVKDLAGSISIYTKDFMEDVNATDASSLLIFATNMESSGGNVGNYSGSAADINESRPVSDSARSNPQGTTRARGLGSPSYTRGYFLTSIPFDSYNVSAYTVQRGPNSALFGTGSPAGIMDATLLQPDLLRNKYQARIRYGSSESLRETLDLNQVLIPKKLAFRLALLNDDNKFNQEPAFEKKARLYGALTYKPFKNSEFRANFETGTTQANRPLTTLPYKGYTKDWFDAGRPAYDWRLYDYPELNPAAASVSAGSTGAGAYPAYMGMYLTYGPLIVYNTPTQATPTTGFQFRDLTTSGTTANAVRNGTFNPLVNRDLSYDLIEFMSTRGYYSYPATYFVGPNVYPGQQPNYQPVGMKAETFSDFEAFDWNNQMIDTSSRQQDSFHTFNLAFSQTAWHDRIGFELVYDAQRYDALSKNSFFQNANVNWIFIDTNVTLPDGTANPNLGRPFVCAGMQNWSFSYDRRDSQRATAFLKYDFADLSRSWGKLLGSHTLTGVYARDNREIVSYARQLRVAGAASEASDTGNIFTSYRRPSWIVYMGPSVIGNSNPVKLQTISVAPIVAGPTTDITYFVRSTGTTDEGHFERSKSSLVEVNGGGSAFREVVESKAFTLQSNWLDGMLITTLGWRQDEDYYARTGLSFVANPADRNDPGRVHYGLDDFSYEYTPKPSVGEETKTFGVVVPWPQKLVRLPKQIDDLRVFLNKSENFTPIGGRVNFFNEPWPTPTGNTKEWGFSAAFLDEKLSIRFSRFQTKLKNVTSTPSGEANAVLNATLQLATGWAKEANAAPAMAAKSNADIELLFSALPSNFRQIYNFTVSGTAPNIASSSNTSAVPGVDTSSVSAQGFEADIVYNPSKNWRMTVNVAHQVTVQSDMAPFMKAYVARMKSVWTQLSSRPAGVYQTGFQPGDTMPASQQTYGQYLDTNVYVPFATALAAEGTSVAELRKWRVNLITGYTFGRDSIFGDLLKGWGVGGTVRWQDKLGIGYPSSRDPNGTAHFDIANPYQAPTETNVGAWVSYSRTFAKKYRWTARLTAENLIGSMDLIPVTMQSWNGTVAAYRLAPGRRWYFENTLEF